MIVRVKLPESNKIYDFKSDIEVVKGDKVLCDTSRGPVIGIVNSVGNFSNKATMWLMSRIDVDAHRKRIVELNKEEQKRLAHENRRSKFYPNTNVVCPIQLQADAFLSPQDAAMQKLIGGKSK